ncbi:MAG: cupin domain-containing protein [bacterium]
MSDWFVVNLAEAQAFRHADFGSGVIFEGADGGFEQLGVNVRWLEPGQPASMYHAEAAQEAYLVLHGEATLIVDDTERALRAWDFVHLPPGTAHVLVGAGEGPCAVLMVGARLGEEQGLRFPVSMAAARYGASVEAETTDRAEAYAGKPSGFEPRQPFWPPSE